MKRLIAIIAFTLGLVAAVAGSASAQTASACASASATVNGDTIVDESHCVDA